MTPEQSAALRVPFPPEQIGEKPQPYKKDSPKGLCAHCGQNHGLPAMHLSYVGHAAVTDRLIAVDPDWTWEPMATDPSTGAPLMANGGLWIRLTVAGVTRIGFGDGSSVKECIGDAIRNAAMRFGAALDLWAKESLIEGQHDAPSPGVAAPDPAKQQARQLRLDIASIAQTEGWDLDVLVQEFTQTFGISTSSAGPDDLAAYLSELQARASGGAPADETPTDAPPQPDPPSPGEGSAKPPAKTADQYRDELLAATEHRDVIRVLRDLSAAGLADEVVGDANSEKTTLNTLAAVRLKATKT